MRSAVKPREPGPELLEVAERALPVLAPSSGVHGSSSDGIGVSGSSVNSTGVLGYSSYGTAGKFVNGIGTKQYESNARSQIFRHGSGRAV